MSLYRRKGHTSPSVRNFLIFWRRSKRSDWPPPRRAPPTNRSPCFEWNYGIFSPQDEVLIETLIADNNNCMPINSSADGQVLRAYLLIVEFAAVCSFTLSPHFELSVCSVEAAQRVGWTGARLVPAGCVGRRRGALPCDWRRRRSMEERYQPRRLWRSCGARSACCGCTQK